MNDNMITVLLIKPLEVPEVCTIKNDLKTLQEMVGGNIELLNIDERVTSIFNEEGIRENLKPNRIIRENTILGNIIISGYDADSGELTSLTEEELAQYKKFFTKAENMAMPQTGLVIYIV